jgi:hypothetical protein
MGDEKSTRRRNKKTSNLIYLNVISLLASIEKKPRAARPSKDDEPQWPPSFEARASPLHLWMTDKLTASTAGLDPAGGVRL